MGFGLRRSRRTFGRGWIVGKAQLAPKERTASPDGSDQSSGFQLYRLVATGRVRAKMYDTAQGDYRYARGSRMTWERVTNQMVLTGPDALAWGPGGEWRGEEITVSRNAGGGLYIHSLQTETIFFVDEKRRRTPKSPHELDQWEPID